MHINKPVVTMTPAKRDTVAIFTNENEPNIEDIKSSLLQDGNHVFRCNTDRLLLDGFELHLNERGGRLITDSDSVDIGRIKSVLIRRARVETPQSEDEEDRLVYGYISGELKAALWSLYTTLDVFWMNHPLRATRLLEANKFYQLKVATSVGLETPTTIISNNPEEIIGFCSNHGGFVALKSLHPFPVIGEDGNAYAMFTQKIDLDYLREHREDLVVCPMFVQEYIEKRTELRVTIVGRTVFCCEIDSQASDRTSIDWRRYDPENVSHRPYQLPENIQDRLLSYMERLGLSFGAVDLILTPDNRYVFLEINPSGQYGWIENLTEFPISQKIARALSDGG